MRIRGAGNLILRDRRVCWMRTEIEFIRGLGVCILLDAVVGCCGAVTTAGVGSGSI